jgi:hypothetical protein
VYDGLTLMGYSTGQLLCKILLLICAIELIGSSCSTTAVMVTCFILSLRKTHLDLQNGAKLTAGEQVPGTTIQFRQEPEWTSSSMRPCRQAERQQPETDLYELKWMNNGET